MGEVAGSILAVSTQKRNFSHAQESVKSPTKAMTTAIGAVESHTYSNTKSGGTLGRS